MLRRATISTANARTAVSNVAKPSACSTPIRSPRRDMTAICTEPARPAATARIVASAPPDTGLPYDTDDLPARAGDDAAAGARAAAGRAPARAVRRRARRDRRAAVHDEVRPPQRVPVRLAPRAARGL